MSSDDRFMRTRFGLFALAVNLLYGCASPTDECVWTDTLYYDSTDVVNWLSRNDPSLLADVTAHNEKREEFCR